MFIVRRGALVLIAFALALAAGPSHGGAWPQRAVRIILPLPAGGGTDLAARLFAERLSERWRQSVVVENRPGPDGIVGVTGFVNSRDEHTLLFANAGPISINPLIHQNLPYDPARDLVPIASAIDNFFAIAVSSSLGVDSIGAFVALARKEPRGLNWTATAGLPQYIFEALQKNQGLEMTYVPYRDFAQALQDFGEGRVHAVATGVPILLPQVQLGKAKLLMVTNRERSALAEDVPTAKEAGHPELLFEGVVGFYGWRDIPADLRERIAADVRAVASDSAMTARLRGIGVAVRAGTPAEFAADIEAQRARITAIVRPAKPAN
jgi:tripartite-type tricarboxylate transporter receptor subunit TctC